MSKKSNRFPSEVRERAFRLVLENRGEFPSLWATIEPIAPKIGCVPQTLNDWVRQHKVDAGVRDGVNCDERALITDLERETKELSIANEILKLTKAFYPCGARPPTEVLRAFVDKHRATHGVEPICKVLQIAPADYSCHAALQSKSELLCAQAKRDKALIPQIQVVWQANMQVYGADNIWHQINREGTKVARCTVERLMKRLGLHGVSGARSCAPRSRTKPRTARWTGSTVSSKPIGPTSCGCRTSPRSALGRADNTWPL